MPSLYLKIDIEQQTSDCVHALGTLKATYPFLGMPKFISMEDGTYFGATKMLNLLTEVGYTKFKVVSQRWYCPKFAPMGCGSGLFGNDAVDIFSGHYWRTKDDILGNEEALTRVYSDGWYDLHASL